MWIRNSRRNATSQSNGEMPTEPVANSTFEELPKKMKEAFSEDSFEETICEETSNIESSATKITGCNPTITILY